MTDAQPAPTPAEPSRPGLDIERNRMLMVDYLENAWNRHWADDHGTSAKLLGVIPFDWGWVPGPIRSLGDYHLNDRPPSWQGAGAPAETTQGSARA